jgi:hypothetical protein
MELKSDIGLAVDMNEKCTQGDYLQNLIDWVLDYVTIHRMKMRYIVKVEMLG